MLHIGLPHKLWLVPKSPARGHQIEPQLSLTADNSWTQWHPRVPANPAAPNGLASLSHSSLSGASRHHPIICTPKHCLNTGSQLTLSNPYLLWHTSVLEPKAHCSLLLFHLNYKHHLLLLLHLNYEHVYILIYETMNYFVA